MAPIRVVWLIDSDPPSEIGGGRGFYPVSHRTDPPDAALMTRRIALALALAREAAGGRAVTTVHTSPRYRDHFFAEPYLSLWRDCAAAGMSLALHPHEDRADGSSLYDDAGHLAGVVRERMAAARAAGLPLTVFRSGTFAFNPALPALLAREGLALDLSAAPGLELAGRAVSWSRRWASAAELPLPTTGEAEAGGAGSGVVTVPIGWDGAGTSLDANYLFCERLTFAALAAVWAKLRRAAEDGRPRLVNFLSHGFGLEEPRWRDQTLRFLDHLRSHGGELVGAEEALALCQADTRPAAAASAGG